MTSAKKIIKFFLPKKLAEARANFQTTKKLINSYYRYSDTDDSALSHIFHSIKLYLFPKKTLSFYPEIPRSKAVIFDLCAYLNYKIVRGPFNNGKYEIFYNDSTYIDFNELKGLSIPDNALNGKCLDISKENVQNCFRKAFGYSLELDPTTHKGQALRKSNLNYTHDGMIIETPIRSSEVDKKFVYQKAINNKTEKGYFLDYRVPVYGEEIPLVYKKYRCPTNRFKNVSHAEIASVISVFSDTEIKQIVRFSKLLNLDFGELDILRDNDNGKIYIVDANKTPSHSSLSDELKKQALKELSKYFEKLIT